MLTGARCKVACYALAAQGATTVTTGALTDCTAHLPARYGFALGPSH